jgi:hypothetical protein
MSSDLIIDHVREEAVMLKRTGPGKTEIRSNPASLMLFNFDIDGDQLKIEHKNFLLTQATARLRNGAMVQVVGLADRIGDRTYNQQLSERRARATVEFLKLHVHNLKVAPPRGFGEDKMALEGFRDGLTDEKFRSVLVFITEPRIQKIETARFWINAFIPDTVSGLTRELLGGPDRGKSVIDFFGLYATDRRKFSSVPGISSRLQLEITVDCEKHKAKSSAAKCHESISYDDLIFGHVTGRKSATPKFDVNDSTGVMKFSAAAPNPLAPPGAPDIDFQGSLDISVSKGTLELDCLIDDFPYYEAYVIVNEGAPFKLFEAPPVAGKTPLDLIGPPRRRIHIIARDADKDGVLDQREIMSDSIQPVQ